MSDAQEGFSTSPYRKLSDDEIAELQKHLPSVRMREQASLIEHQAARIKELEAQVTWQPIETAPKTGISVLLWDEDSSECTIGWYRINHKDDSWRSEYDLNLDATYWMPLPNMPKENET